MIKWIKYPRSFNCHSVINGFSCLSFSAENVFGIIMTIVNIINLCFMVYFNVSNLPAVKKMVKKMTGKLEFSDPNGGPVPFQPMIMK